MIFHFDYSKWKDSKPSVTEGYDVISFKVNNVQYDFIAGLDTEVKGPQTYVKPLPGSETLPGDVEFLDAARLFKLQQYKYPVMASNQIVFSTNLFIPRWNEVMTADLKLYGPVLASGTIASIVQYTGMFLAPKVVIVTMTITILISLALMVVDNIFRITDKITELQRADGFRDDLRRLNSILTKYEGSLEFRNGYIIAHNLGPLTENEFGFVRECGILVDSEPLYSYSFRVPWRHGSFRLIRRPYPLKLLSGTALTKDWRWLYDSSVPDEILGFDNAQYETEVSKWLTF